MRIIIMCVCPRHHIVESFVDISFERAVHRARATCGLVARGVGLARPLTKAVLVRAGAAAEAVRDHAMDKAHHHWIAIRWP